MDRAQPTRFGLVATIRDEPGAMEAYVEAHRAVWPEVIEDGRTAGVRLTCIYRDGRQLFMYMEADPDYDLNGDAMAAASDVTREWQRRMDLLLEDQPGAAAGGKWRPIDLVVMAS